MSFIAKAEKMKVVSPKMSEPSSTLNLNLAKDKTMQTEHAVGDKIHFHGHGKITSIHHDNYGHTMHVEIHKIHPKGEIENG